MKKIILVLILASLSSPVLADYESDKAYNDQVGRQQQQSQQDWRAHVQQEQAHQPNSGPKNIYQNYNSTPTYVPVHNPNPPTNIYAH